MRGSRVGENSSIIGILNSQRCGVVIQGFSNTLLNRIISIIDSQGTWSKEDIKSQIVKVFTDATYMYAAVEKLFEHSNLNSRVLTILEGAERKKIIQMLLLTFGNKNRTAEVLGFSHNALLDKMKRYGIKHY